MDTQTVVGGWTDFDFTISAQAHAVFDQTVGKLIGVKYVPIAVATQTVSGTNYCFLCDATGVYPGACTSLVEVYVYQPLQGAPHITAIKMVMECHAIPGGWSGFHAVTPDEQKIFAGVVKPLGVNYEPLQVATQVVAGLNYCYLCKASIVSPGAVAYPTLVYIFQPLPGAGAAHITAIVPIKP